jgi:hypothetical protein
MRQELRRRQRARFTWNGDGLPVKPVIVAPVLGLLPDSSADHNEPVVRINGHVSLVKEAMEIASQ